jgi:hypothetical protein
MLETSPWLDAKAGKTWDGQPAVPPAKSG